VSLQVQVLRASTAREIEEAFAAIGQNRPDALFVGSAAFLNIRRIQLVQLASYHRLPVTFSLREAAEAGGLMSYGPSIEDAYRQWAAYAGRILKGAKPADLPVVQASKFELVVNLTTAGMLGLALPDRLLVRDGATTVARGGSLGAHDRRIPSRNDRARRPIIEPKPPRAGGAASKRCYCRISCGTV
jgi:ABC-type uncharacterized transport system substrate-binding protein